MDKNTSEIAKLTERISKDPKSKLFVPLAEEYKKTGDIEMSIHVLNEGLKNNPGYVTARSFLGKLLIDKGDYPSAQKEFEEVIKAIPDNLMAHRKLGDVYALQGRPADAVTQYKLVLTMNPKDSETAMLVAEAEAGRDIQQFLGPKSTEQKKQQKLSATSTVAADQQTSKPAPMAKKAEQAADAAQPVAKEQAEDVLHVEPLEPEQPDVFAAVEQPQQTALAPELDFLAETAPLPEVDAGQDGGSIDVNEPFALDQHTEPEPVKEEENDQIQLPPLSDPFQLQEEPSVSQPDEIADAPFALNEPFETEPVPAEPALEEIQNEVPALLLEEELMNDVPSEGDQPLAAVDDFTTDTLAELYISQGFFEKAIDIYERMLADNPNSQGLKDKLSNVRAMAAAAVPSDDSDQEAQPLALEMEAEPEETAALTTESESEPIPRAAIPGDQPRLDDWELPATTVINVSNDEPQSAPKTPRPAKPFEVGFEPREYVPPDAVLKDKAEEIPAGHAALQARSKKTDPQEAAPSGNMPSGRRKETVDRLESWLKNIMKES